MLFLATLLVSRRTRAHREMAERARQAEAARERSAAEAVAAERTRITREMHDVVAHSLTVAVVQCVSAADDLDRGAADLAAIGQRVRAAENECRDALDELRRMLGVLRYGAEPLVPTPRLTELPDLARAIGATGVVVELSMDGDLGGLPPGVELSCYRIVQEALTHRLKHSGAKNARVLVSGLSDNVRVRVGDDGGGTKANGTSPGQGLIGMRDGSRLRWHAVSRAGTRRRLPGGGRPAARLTQVIRLVVADDQELVRDGFCSILDREPDLAVVAQAADGVQAIAAAASTRPDVVLLDIRMPVMDGLQAGRRMLAGPSPPKVLVLTTFDADEYAYEALRFGASGFLLKDVRSGEQVEAVRTVAAGHALLSPTITRRLIERFVRAVLASRRVRWQA